MAYPSDSYHNPLVQTTRKNPLAEEFEWGTFLKKDKVRLFYRGWKLAGIPLSSTPTVILHIHGIISHSEPYIAMADGLVDQNTLVYGLDLEGHGYSEGRRGDFKDYRMFLQDIDEFLYLLHEKYPTGRLILSGESMGGVMVTCYMLENPPEKCPVRIEKALLWAPAFKPSLGSSPIRTILGGIGMVFRLIFCPGWVSIRTTHRDTFRDPAALALDIADPVNLQKYAMRYLWNFNKGIQAVWNAGPYKLQYPVCIIHGSGDRIVSQPASQQFFDGLKMKTESKYFLVPDAWHCLYKDPGFTEVYWREIHNFLKS